VSVGGERIDCEILCSCLPAEVKIFLLFSFFSCFRYCVRIQALALRQSVFNQKM